ncbi:RagB/SusD family nutrient uptake outer membrane protein [Mangrovibacterium diazotrophicum]|nr:RagB/SusD family nutrient uptake outer membrane protein [Mangrovibacterium diazotrophicum]
MKKLLYTLILVPFFGCSGFLDEVDQDLLVPEKTDHYAALLLNEFNYQYPIFDQIDYMTDNMVEDSKMTTLDKFDQKTTYTWQREIEIDEEGNEITYINEAWQYMYEDIAIANYVIELIDDAMGEQSEIDQVKGEAYFIRALSYFNLLNLYGQPFNAASADVDLGVPLRDDIGVEETYNRNTVAEGYALIEADLTEARQLLEASGLTTSIWHPGVAACDLLMSRVKLYQQEWSECIEYAGRVIASGSLSKVSASSPFVDTSNKEILYSYYATNPVFSLYDSFGKVQEYSYHASKELINLYDDEDNRKDAFFDAIDDGTGKYNYFTLKYQKGSYTSLGFANLRVGEAYLNRAEAYAEMGDVASAVSDMKALHAVRYSDPSVVSYPTDAAEVLDFVLTDRRKELCFEDHHRWFDLRRMANRPEIKHVFTLINASGAKLGTETYTLLSDDPNYTLPIPLKERENNPLIRNNERYEKIPTIDEEIIIP